jgi:hypothetical protein
MKYIFFALKTVFIELTIVMIANGACNNGPRKTNT